MRHFIIMTALIVLVTKTAFPETYCISFDDHSPGTRIDDSFFMQYAGPVGDIRVTYRRTEAYSPQELTVNDRLVLPINYNRVIFEMPAEIMSVVLWITTGNYVWMGVNGEFRHATSFASLPSYKSISMTKRTARNWELDAVPRDDTNAPRFIEFLDFEGVEIEISGLCIYR